MTEAGYPNGFEVTMDCPNDRYVNDEQICQAVVSMLAKNQRQGNPTGSAKVRKYFAKVLFPRFRHQLLSLISGIRRPAMRMMPLSMLAAVPRQGKGLANTTSAIGATNATPSL